MVVICCKRIPKDEHSKDYDEFLMNFPNTTNIGEVTDSVQKMQNSRIRLKWMVAAARQLAKDNCPEDMKHVLTGPADDADRYLALERSMERKLDCKHEEISALCDTIKGGATIAFPQDCTGSDVLQRHAAVLDSDTASDVERSKSHRILSIVDDGATTDDIMTGTATMWWSSKPMARDAELNKYTGKNEKTKIIVKLTAEGGTAPPREPAIDARTQNEMMAFWYKKQEEAKKLVEDDDVSFGNSEWANPSGLKNQLQGQAGIKFKPM